jgi:hypothetical protein
MTKRRRRSHVRRQAAHLDAVLEVWVVESALATYDDDDMGRIESFDVEQRPHHVARQAPAAMGDDDGGHAFDRTGRLR